jgi:hypothetical protein
MSYVAAVVLPNTHEDARAINRIQDLDWNATFAVAVLAVVQIPLSE